MRHLTRLSLGLGFVGTLAFIGCSSSDNAGGLQVIGHGGQGGAAVTNGGQPGASGSDSAGTFGAGGTITAGGGGSGGTAGDTSALGGSAGTFGMAGTGGAAPVPVPAVVLFDTILIRPKSAGGLTGAAGEGGADGQAGAPSGGTGGTGGTGGGSGGDTAAAGAVGEGGAPTTTADFSRSFTFDTALQNWALHAEGSTPNIGLAGGGEKLSARSTLSVNTTDGNPSPGSMQISIPFATTGEQLDVNQLFAAAGNEEDWSGYEMVAKVKVVSSGNMPDCLGAWVYATSTGFVFARGAEVQVKPADSWVNLRFDLDAPDVGGSKAAFDKTKINQFGVMVLTNLCP